jgi:hypothetical protein
MTQSKILDDCKTGVRRLAADFVPRNRDEARAYEAFCLENFEPFDWPKAKRRRKRRRRASVVAAIRQARKAGERGPVSVTLPDGTTITSESESSAVAGTANPWDTVLRTHDATH